MRKMLNVLYVTNPDAYLAKDGENIVVKVHEGEVFRTPIHYLEGIVTFGYMGASPALMGMCVQKQVTVSFLTVHGRHQATLHGVPKGNVFLRRKQYRLADSNIDSAKLASMFITGKLANCRTVLRRFLRDYEKKSQTSEVEQVCKLLAQNVLQLAKELPLEEIRGIEGESARHYFSVLDQLILYQKDYFYMHGRNRRPPKDNVNTLLSFLYSLLLHETRSALETVGLDSYVGFLHRDRPGRAGLALDLMEELRPYMADRMALSLINRRQVNSKGFVVKESGGIIMKENARKTLIEAWQKRKREEITHPFLGKKIPVGLLPYAQALLLSRHLRGDLDSYPPFVWK
ncbi:MAG: type I-C CRISPR-associated endonuclease Cas1c [Clostridiales bacterium]|nr:type I-C CRISPR-associated endonuclease Cas1c [Clostridiales bacterium]MCF8022943.1 type I-C CRISPR-associated endonuclease Cas1c [Clostridiales bacterium]